MLYFLLHDATAFRRISAGVAASWRRRSFGPVLELAADLEPSLAAFGDRFHLTPDEWPLLKQLTTAQRFDRRLWRHLAGELLLYAAADAPPVQSAAQTLDLLVAADQQASIRQAHAGSRDLDFDGVPYRPDQAGLNDTADVVRLADDLGNIDPANWNEAALADNEPAEELAFARDCFAALRAVYVQARQRGQVVICEEI